jgi:hypothetical protein
MSLLDSFATSADQERLREKAIRNLQSLQEANVPAPHAREVISSLWIRSLSAAQDAGGSRREVQLDITRATVVDDNSFTNELATIVEGSFNIHEVGTQEKRYCFRLPENPESKLKAWARNDNAFKPQVAAAPGLLSVGHDQEYLRTVLNYVLKSPEGTNEQPSQPIVFDPNWEKAPWANVTDSDKPVTWADRGIPVLLVLPVAPTDLSESLGPWLVDHVPVNRNMARFLLPKQGALNIFDDRDLLVMARCALLARDWKASDSQYDKLHKKYEGALKVELKSRFDRYAVLGMWDFQQPKNCTFHVENHGATGSDIPSAVETHLRVNFFAPEDVEKGVISAAERGESIGQLLSMLREPSLPGAATIPFLGDNLTYEFCLSLAARDKIALDVGGRWYHKESDETEREALARLRSRAWKTGRELLSIRLGKPSQVGSTGVAAVPAPTLFPPSGAPATPIPVGAGPSAALQSTRSSIAPSPGAPTTSDGAPPLPAQPVIRRSIGAKTGMNLLGDLERWALPDQQRVTQASLTVTGVTIKDLRELVTKLPPRIQAELQLMLPPEEEATR